MVMSLILANDNQSFDALAEKMMPKFSFIVQSFSHDGMLSRTEDYDSLMNVARWKLWECRREFKPNPELDEAGNVKLFIAFARHCIRNRLIDLQYGANVASRKPANKMLSLNYELDNADDAGATEGSDTVTYVDPTQHESHYGAVANEAFGKVFSMLEDQRERTVLAMLCEGFKPQQIASKMGYQTSFVNRVIYTKIQPGANAYDPSYQRRPRGAAAAAT